MLHSLRLIHHFRYSFPLSIIICLIELARWETMSCATLLPDVGAVTVSRL
ncbi:MAG: hypothetical protein HGB16_03735, partial [Chlorobaculum sp.]|nr:hypothetical protein [Chlorobaculum sp.]